MGYICQFFVQFTLSLLLPVWAGVVTGECPRAVTGAVRATGLHHGYIQSQSPAHLLGP